jgi:hypothetical protein
MGEAFQQEPFVVLLEQPQLVKWPKGEDLFPGPKAQQHLSTRGMACRNGN